MRITIVSALALGCLVPACGGETPSAQAPQTPPAVSVNSASTPPVATAPATPEPPKPALSDLEVSVMQAGIDALNAHDAAKLTALYTDDALITFPGMPDAKGKDAITQAMQAEWTAFPDAKYAWSRLWQSNEVAILESAFNGTNTGPMMGGKATGKPVGYQALTIFWFTPDGKVKEQHDYADLGSVAMQLGMPKAMGRPFVGLPTTTEKHMAKGTPDEQKNVDMTKNLDQVMSKKDAATFLSSLTDDSEYVMNTQPGSMKGIKTAETWFKSFTKAFPDLNVTPTNVWAVEDYVIHEYTMTGTQKGPLGGPKGAIPATGKTINVHSAEIIQIKDGKMLKGWGYSNGAEMAMQLGLMKPPGQQAPAAPGAKTDAKATK